MHHPSHTIVSEEWVLGWGTEDVAVCTVCGKWGYYDLGKPCVPPQKPAPQPVDLNAGYTGWGPDYTKPRRSGGSSGWGN